LRGQVFIPTSHAAQFGVRATTEQGRAHHPNDLAQQFLLLPEAPFDLGQQVCGETQVLECLLQDLGSVLGLAAITCKALLCGAAATLPDFALFFRVSFRWGHAGLLKAKPSCFLLSTICGIHTPERLCQFPYVFCTPHLSGEVHHDL
jgi:hypothetical protein